MHRIAAIALLVVGAAAQMQPQCLCSDFNPCLESAPSAIQHCGTRCQNHVTELGGNIPAVRQCIVAHQGQIRQAIGCAKARVGTVCANMPGQMVPRRFPETFQLAAARELNSQLTRSGLLAEATPLLQAGRRALTCLMRCGQQNSCVKKLKCGLALPSDSEAISIGKQCAFQAGFSTPVAREICGCLVNAGIHQLAPICPKIVIS